MIRRGEGGGDPKERFAGVTLRLSLFNPGAASTVGGVVDERIILEQ